MRHGACLKPDLIAHAELFVRTVSSYKLDYAPAKKKLNCGLSYHGKLSETRKRE
jgi:hypothetical protein